MSKPTTPPLLILPCKDCHQPVKESESNGYRLIAGIFYGWCNECFKKQQRFLRFGQPLVQSVATTVGVADSLGDKIDKLTDTTTALIKALQQLSGSQPRREDLSRSDGRDPAEVLGGVHESHC